MAVGNVELFYEFHIYTIEQREWNVELLHEFHIYTMEQQEGNVELLHEFHIYTIEQQEGNKINKMWRQATKNNTSEIKPGKK